VPLFDQRDGHLVPVEQTNFALERDLQRLIEHNLEAVFSCRLVATEFATGSVHAGRIDTLGLSEDGNPVVIEYKKVESSELINQSLFYLNWIADHRGDFELAAQRTLGSDIQVDWADIRVICIAPNYKKYDLHAVQVMGANIELWRYRLFSNGSLFLEEVFRPQRSPTLTESQSSKNPTMVAAGKKAAITRQTAVHSTDQHLEGKPSHIVEMFQALREHTLALDESVDEVPKKYYVAFKAAKNFTCLEVQQRKILVFLKLQAPDFAEAHGVKYRDVSKIGHFGTGDAEVTVENMNDVEGVKPFVAHSFARVGGA